jgi:Rps23 Pro-64 3,4-dihydroxylase Tpa1-like proline 4-hydroxylase
MNKVALEDIESLSKKFREAKPFPHIVIDGFWDERELSVVEKELRKIPLEVWMNKRDPTSGQMITQKNKLAIKDPKCLGIATQAIMRAFSSTEMCEWLSKLSGIENLQPDPDFLGGGVHRIDDGGKLSIHADFNIHPETRKYRRLNALLYLNKRWQPDNHGELELWECDENRKLTKIASKIEPIFNRLVVFRITDDAFHGHPEPWESDDGYYRLSLAFYYYTDDRPESEKAPFHWATWKERPVQGY